MELFAVAGRTTGSVSRLRRAGDGPGPRRRAVAGGPALALAGPVAVGLLGLVVQERLEALGLTNVVIGGFFFRADGNGDGVVTPEEGRKARVELMNQSPAAAALFKEARTTTGQSPFATLARLFDVDYGKPLTIAEARDAAHGAVDDLYRASDKDRDGILSRAETSRSRARVPIGSNREK